MALDSPLEVLVRAHEAQLELCDTLEHIADDLPGVVPAGVVRWIGQALTHDIPLHHRDEEHGLFPLLERRCGPGDMPEGTIAMLRAEHSIDEGLAGEIAEALALHADTSNESDPNALGYMLRCFFECYRRHMVWEDAIVLPLARRVLTKGDLRDLQQCMLDQRAAAGLCGAMAVYSRGPGGP